MDTSEDFKGGSYLSVDTTKDGDIIEIMNEGVKEMGKDWQGKDKMMFNLTVKNGTEELIWSPWPRDGQKLQKAWGMDSSKWIGKKVQIIHEKNKMIARPIVEEKVDGNK